MASLKKLLSVQRLAVKLRRLYFVKIWGMDIHPTVLMSMSAKLDLTNPKGIHIGEKTYIAFDAAILAHDMTRRMHCDTRIGANCFIGARSIILPGITIGDGSIVGAGSVVTKDVPACSIVAGNPATIIRRDVVVEAYGRLPRSQNPTAKAAQ